MSQQIHDFLDFGPFRLDRVERLLWRAGQVVPLTPKAIDLLIVLADSDGRVLSKRDLVDTVWPDTFVEEANLSHQMHRLRSALGDGEDGATYIETLNRRGYRFTAPVTRAARAAPGAVEATWSPASENLEPVEKPQAPRRFPRAAAALAALGALILVGSLGPGWLPARESMSAPPARIQTVAVLPFTALSSETRNEAFELGMADAVITRLSGVRQIIVRPTSAVLKYVGSQDDVLSIGREQRVDAVLEGKIQKAPGRVRVTVQLLQVADGRALWAQTFDQPAEDLFAIQDAISIRVADALRVTLNPADRTRLAQRGTSHLDAYEAYVRGLYYANSFGAGSFADSVAEFRRAIAIDPAYADPHAGLAAALSSTGFERQAAPQTLAEAKSMAERALQLDDTSGEVHAALVTVRTYLDWDWAAAERECQRLIELRPNDPRAHQTYGWYLNLMARYPEALIELRTAQLLDPLSTNITIALGWVLVASGDPDRGLEELERIAASQPAYAPGRATLALALFARGRLEDAVATTTRAPAPLGVVWDSTLGFLLAKAGRRAEAEQILARLSAPGDRPAAAYLVAAVWAGLGRTDDALAWLNKAYDEHSPWIPWLKTDVQFDALRGDARFKALLQRVKLD